MWDGQAGLGVPSGAIEHQHDDALASCPDRACESREQLLEERLVEAVRQIPDGFPAAGMHERGDVEPLITMVPECDRAVADGRPHAATNGFQAEPVLVRRPYFDRLVRIAACFRREDVGEPFLKSASSSGVADFGFFGRGSCSDQPSFLSASQPRGA